MDIIYRVTYIPHLNTDLPKYYIGSKKNWQGGKTYLGSIASKKVESFTDGLSLAKWWKQEKKNHPERFEIEILESYEELDKEQLIEREIVNQRTYDIIGNDYFNKAFARAGWISQPRDDETKALIAEKTRQYWNSPEGKAKKKKLVARNKKESSARMQARWDNDDGTMRNAVAERLGEASRNRTREEWQEIARNRKPRKVCKACIDGKIYSLEEASEKFGIHIVNVRRRCRLPQYENWSYYE